jgi:Cu-processing system permease protein
MRGLLTIARLTLHEAMRKRILLATSIGGVAFLVLYAIGFHFIARSMGHSVGVAANAERQIGLTAFTLAGLYAVDFLGLVSAVLLPLDTLSGEIASGVIQTIASKPVRRSDIVLGKWLAYVVVLVAYVLVLATGVLTIAWASSGHVPPGILIGIPLMLLQAVLLVSLSIFGGSRFTTVTNGVIAFGLYGLAFIGNWIEQIGGWTNNLAAQNVGTIASLIMPTECLWQLAAHHMQPAVIAQLHVTPFSPVIVPSPAMVVWACAWGVAAVTAAVVTFERRAL